MYKGRYIAIAADGRVKKSRKLRSSLGKEHFFLPRRVSLVEARKVISDYWKKHGHPQNCSNYTSSSSTNMRNSFVNKLVTTVKPIYIKRPSTPSPPVSQRENQSKTDSKRRCKIIKGRERCRKWRKKCRNRKCRERRKKLRFPKTNSSEDKNTTRKIISSHSRHSNGKHRNRENSSSRSSRNRKVDEKSQNRRQRNRRPEYKSNYNRNNKNNNDNTSNNNKNEGMVRVIEQSTYYKPGVVRPSLPKNHQISSIVNNNNHRLVKQKQNIFPKLGHNSVQNLSSSGTKNHQPNRRYKTIKNESIYPNLLRTSSESSLPFRRAPSTAAPHVRHMRARTRLRRRRLPRGRQQSLLFNATTSSLSIL